MSHQHWLKHLEMPCLVQASWGDAYMVNQPSHLPEITTEITRQPGLVWLCFF